MYALKNCDRKWTGKSKTYIFVFIFFFFAFRPFIILILSKISALVNA